MTEQNAVPTDGWQFVLADSLEKIYPDAPPRPLDRTIPMSVFPGEIASVQVAIRPPMKHDFRVAGPLEVSVDGASAGCVSISQVELVPCSLAAFPEHGSGYDRDTPGLYPDLLRPASEGLIQPRYGQWTAAWIDLVVPSADHAGDHEVGISVRAAEGRVLFTTGIKVTVLAVPAPELGIVNAHWFHCDGLAAHYGVGVFSEEHWSIIDAFMGSAARMGANSLLTPTWTPPLDTAVGGTRLPTQLIGISEDSGYHFDFSKLLRWVDLCAKHGIRYLEIAHLFTQWGAKATPAIYVGTTQGLERRFGWDVPARSASYRELMAELLPALRSFLAEHWSLDRVIFHISDEPEGAEALEGYQEAKDVVADLLEGLTVVDALSDFEFYGSGAVPNPAVATDAVAPFLKAGVKDLWVYYCVAQPIPWPRSIRSRTPAPEGFPGGDAFMVYPGPDGVPWESIRYKVFAQAMWDHRAFSLLAQLACREDVLALIDTNGSGGRLAMDSFSYDPVHYARVRELVNEGIAQRVSQTTS
ncbi:MULTISPECIES: DUF4091 domain-containing protein [Arthrobacter]|uniref:DUF4091 domain-containing protein n=1 Tax=Arthrobacter terricola TaxID=2547396 RepID=A0A4R5L104_9MICC|nr:MULTISPECIES: DUF4091 domain-containing protein [Arthrobacter]MBT8160048.1 DUF4091 domain-containing protein [Arthrobacter sp. GN70]TDG01051.1 DUF4091 domain-containing protein [Arthrobacter terricola]